MVELMSNPTSIYLPESDNHFAAAGWDYQKAQREAAIESCLNLKRTRTAIDVGAHVGIWTRRFSEVFDKVVSFEPCPENLACLYKNTDGLDNVTIHDAAAAESPDVLMLKRLRPTNSGMWCLTGPGEEVKSSEGSTYFVRVIRLDDLHIPDVDLIKIDVEGFEPRVLLGARETLQKYHPVLCVEAKEPDSEERIMMVLDFFELTYKMNRVGSEVIYTPSSPSKA
jgi:FkbM family methyltransferase|tara:strand:+ start:943 stop:1614 length:672 start_codon:yes stop_codon:yes gene_type:complete